MKDEKSKCLLRLQQKARCLPADLDTPISLFMGMADKDDAILLESAEVDGRWGRYSVLACHMAIRISCYNNTLKVNVHDKEYASLEVFTGLPFVDGLRKLMAYIEIKEPTNLKDVSLPPITRGIYGYMSFGMASLFSKRLEKNMPINEAQCIFVLPKTLLLFDHLYNRLYQISLGEHAPLKSSRDTFKESTQNINTDPLSFENSEKHTNPITSTPDANGYKKNVLHIKEMLRQGEAIQVVPSVRFSTKFTQNTFNLYRRMRSINASPYMFYMRLADLTLFGSSPEVMIGCQNGNLQLSPIAGTRKRGENDLRDNELAEELLHDPKERAEHVMLVDLGRNDLGRIAKTNSIKQERYMEVQRFSHVMHLTSKITATLDDNLDALDILAATFPAGTVSGAPKVRAMEIIREVEGNARGPYAGCIGWIGLDKDSVNLDMGITIRSMWHQDETLYWQSGAGIVHDSNPELEWKEICNKSAIMRLSLNTDEIA